MKVARLQKELTEMRKQRAAADQAWRSPTNGIAKLPRSPQNATRSGGPRRLPSAKSRNSDMRASAPVYDPVYGYDVPPSLQHSRPALATVPDHGHGSYSSASIQTTSTSYGGPGGSAAFPRTMVGTAPMYHHAGPGTPHGGPELQHSHSQGAGLQHSHSAGLQMAQWQMLNRGRVVEPPAVTLARQQHIVRTRSLTELLLGSQKQKAGRGKERHLYSRHSRVVTPAVFSFPDYPFSPGEYANRMASIADLHENHVHVPSKLEDSSTRGRKNTEDSATSTTRSHETSQPRSLCSNEGQGSNGFLGAERDLSALVSQNVQMVLDSDVSTGDYDTQEDLTPSRGEQELPWQYHEQLHMHAVDFLVV